LTSNDQAPIAVKIDSAILSATRANETRQNRFLTALRTILRPAKPLIEPLSSPFLRALGWFAHQFERSTGPN
jgi:hypothetical protein